MIRYITPIASLVIGILSFFIANWSFRDFNTNEIGLGQETTSHIARAHGVVKSGIVGNLDSVLLAIKATQLNNAKSSLAIWIGNSQLHAINQYKNGDLLAVQNAQQFLEAGDSDVTLFQFSSPHLNFIEEQIYINTLSIENIRPDFLVLPITFRSFHFIKVREELKRLSGYKEIAKSISDPRVADVFFIEESNDKRGKLLSKHKTWQDESENYIDSLLVRCIPLYIYKDNTKSYIKFLPTLLIHELTDKAKDPKVSGNKEIIEINLLSLKEVIRYAEKNNIKILMYQVPHPQDEQYFFYDRNEYKKFFNEIEEIANGSDKVYYLKLEAIVPINLWGLNNDGFRDTYHFRSEGHKILGDTLARSFNQFKTD